MSKRERIRLNAEDTADQPRDRQRIRDAGPDDWPGTPRITAEPEPVETTESQPLTVTHKNGYTPQLPVVGRPKGTLNHVTAQLRRGIIEAAASVGEDGQGRDGLQGYLRMLARDDHTNFVSLLRRILPQQVKVEADPQSVLGEMLEAVRTRIAMERAKTIDVIRR